MWWGRTEKVFWGPPAEGQEKTGQLRRSWGGDENQGQVGTEGHALEAACALRGLWRSWVLGGGAEEGLDLGRRVWLESMSSPG